MLSYPCHLFCIARRDLGSLKACAPSALLFLFKGSNFRQRNKRKSISVLKLLKDTHISGAGRSKSNIIGSHNTLLLPLLPACDILYLSPPFVNIFLIWFFLHSTVLSCFSLYRSLLLFYSHTYAHTYPGLLGRKRDQACRHQTGSHQI